MDDTRKSIPRQYDRDEIKAARGRELEILRDVAGIPDSYLDGKHHPCPKCGGKDRFRLIDKEAGAVICNQCFKEANGDFIAAVRWMHNVTFPDALKITRWFTGEAFRLMGGLAVQAVEESEADQENRRVVELLRARQATTPEKGLTSREIGRSLFQTKGAGERVESILRRLQAAGTIGAIADKRPTGGPATTRYYLV